jgi:outer membrane protein assembly factor BamB
VSGVSRVKANDPISDHSRASFRDVPLGGMAGSKTPSLAVATRVTPPYFREGTPPVASLVVLPSLQPPYHLRDQSSRDIQKTPSISTIPPSVASALALSDLRAHGIEPKLRWEYGMTRAVSFRLTQTPMRVWAVTDDRGLVALSKVDKTLEVAGKTFEQVAAAPGQAGTMGYAPLGDGTLIAVDLATGNRAGGLNVLWQANVGGLMNHTPIVTDDAVFSGGDNSGVARVDRKSGLVYWRTPNAADRVVAVNQDFLYIQDRVGKLQVFDVRRANGSVLGRTSPLASMDMSAFNVPIANTVSDRLFFASNNGLIVCLRDASPKYATMIRMAPPIDVNPQVKAGVEGLNKAPEAKKEEEPKKEEAKKE